MRSFTKFLGLTEDEIHAFAIGFFEVLCPWKPQHPMTAQAEFKPHREYHYYLAGRAVGIIGLLFLSILFLKCGKELLL